MTKRLPLVFFVLAMSCAAQTQHGSIKLPAGAEICFPDDTCQNTAPASSGGGYPFVGPRPYFDVSAPAYGASGSAQTTTGTISSTSSSLSLSSAIDFVNGQGIAVYGAGPLSSLSPPTGASGSQNRTVANIVNFSTSGRGITHGITCTGTTETVNTFGYAGFPAGASVTLAGTGVGGFNTTATVATISPYPPSYFTITVGSCPAATADGGTVTLNPGSTVFTYQVVAEDANSGYSAAGSTFTVTSAQVLSAQVSNHLTWTASANATQYLIYGDGGLGGALTCLGPAIATVLPATNPSWDDYGTPQRCPLNAPTNPPGSQTAQILITEISSGGGTTSLVLAATASSNATTQRIEHDDTVAINAAISAGCASGGGGLINIPLGTYEVQTLNFCLTTPGSNLVMIIQLQGTLTPRQPLNLNWSNYRFEGILGSGLQQGVDTNGAVIDTVGLNPVWHLHGASTAETFSNLAIDDCPGECMRTETDSGSPNPGSPLYLRLENDYFRQAVMAPGSSVDMRNGTGYGVNFVGGLYSNGENFSIQPAVFFQDGGKIAFKATGLNGSGIRWQCTGAVTCANLEVDETGAPNGGGEAQNTPTVVLDTTAAAISSVRLINVTDADNQAGQDNSIIEIIGTHGVYPLTLINPNPEGGFIFSPSGTLPVKGVVFNCAAASACLSGVGVGTPIPTLPGPSQYTDLNNSIYSVQSPNNVPIQHYIANGTGPLWTVENPLGTILASEDVNGNLISNTIAVGGHLNQQVTGGWGGTCSMVSGTTCTITIQTAYSSAPGCVVTLQGTGTVIAGECSVSGTTITVTAASSNSGTWAAELFGNPN